MSNQVLAVGIGPFGMWEVVVILTILVFLFGAKKLPELARGMGKSLREFKKATSGIEEDIKSAIDEDEKKAEAAKSKELSPDKTSAAK